MANKKHNDPLEEFFAKKLRDYDIQYREEDWQKLEGRLDATGTGKNVLWKRYAVAAAIALLFSVLAYITYDQQQTINQLNERLTNNESLSNPQNPLWVILPDDLFDFSAPDNEPPAASDGSATGSQSDNLADRSQPGISDKAAPPKNEGPDSQDDLQAVGFARLSESTPQTTEHSIAFVSGFELDQEALSKAVRDNGKKDFAAYSDDNVDENDAPDRLSAASELGSRSPSKFILGLLGGPDMSTVGGVSNFYNPGYKLGLSVEYAISNALSLSVGAIHSKVQYTAHGSEYNPPEGYWSYGAVPDETIGQCFIIDIPISLTYTVAHFEHSRLYAAGGISSYIMLNEEYQFEYNGYNTGQPESWQERTGTRHWMSNATVSIGFEQDISKDLSIRAEPFIKIPIREVGWGNVKLYSMGSLFSINYHLP